MVRIGEGGGRVNKSDFLNRVSTRTGVPLQVATDMYEAIIEEILDVVSAGDSLILTGFGKFYHQEHKGHRVQTVNQEGKLAGTDEPEVVADYAVLKFSATRTINRRIGGKAETTKVAKEEVAPQEAAVSS